MRKSTIFAIFSSALAAISTASAATNILADTSFELSTPASQTNPSWNLMANQPDGTNFSAQYQDAPWASNPNGTAGIGLWLKAFEGNAADGFANVTVSQTVSAMPGATYDLALWNKQETNFTAASTFFAIDFLDGGGTVLQTDSQDITDHPQDGSWVEYTMTSVAPAGAADVTVRLGMVDGQDALANPQSAMFDDVTLSTDVIPEPSSALLSLLALAGLSFRRRR